MVFRTIIAGLSTIFVIGPSFAQSDAYCTSFQASMSPSTLYRVATCTDGKECLIPISDFTPIKTGQPHRFLYRTGITQIKNSLVVVQLKYVGVTPRATASDVRLTRHALDFACYRRYKNRARDPIPVDPEDVKRAPVVAYKNYDEFHRFGHTTSDAHDTLSNFHTRYFNGDTCETTTDPLRRAQFLFENREHVGGAFRSVWRRLYGADEGAQAADSETIRKYQELHVVLTNYKKRPQASGCLGFVVQGQGGAVEIGLSDIEENIRSEGQNRFYQRTWTLNVVP